MHNIRAAENRILWRFQCARPRCTETETREVDLDEAFSVKGLPSGKVIVGLLKQAAQLGGVDTEKGLTLEADLPMICDHHMELLEDTDGG